MNDSHSVLVERVLKHIHEQTVTFHCTTGSMNSNVQRYPMLSAFRLEGPVMLQNLFGE